SNCVVWRVREVPEWIGRNDDVRPHTAVYRRVFEKADGHCQECGIPLFKKAWHLDHVIRLKDGGENRESNLQALCVLCHSGKTTEENKLQAKANRNRNRHIGVKKPSSFRKPVRE